MQNFYDKFDDEFTDKVYIKTDENGRITSIDSEWNINDIANWILIDEGIGDKFHHAQGNYLSKQLFSENGCHNYKYADNKIIECSEQEKQAELAEFPEAEPTEIEKIKEQQELIMEVLDVLLMQEV